MVSISFFVDSTIIIRSPPSQNLYSNTKMWLVYDWIVDKKNKFNKMCCCLYFYWFLCRFFFFFYSLRLCLQIIWWIALRSQADIKSNCWKSFMQPKNASSVLWITNVWWYTNEVAQSFPKSVCPNCGRISIKHLNLTSRSSASQ